MVQFLKNWTEENQMEETEVFGFQKLLLIWFGF